MTLNRFIRYYWQGGLELSLMMLDYHAFTGDEAFARETLLPLASEILTFFDQHWQRDAKGKIRFDPAMALETYREAVNPLVEIVGIQKVCEEMLALPEELTTSAQRKQWKRLISELPPVPMRTVNGKKVLACAESYRGKQNVENPELYAIFPYRRYGIGKPELELARRTFAGAPSRRPVAGNRTPSRLPISAWLTKQPRWWGRTSAAEVESIVSRPCGAPITTGLPTNVMARWL